MKQIRFLIMLFLLFTAGKAFADSLLFESVTMKAGETKQVAISLTNPDKQYAAFEFNLVLPEGITVSKDGDGDLMASLDAGRIVDHSLTVSDIGGNAYKFLAFSMKNKEFKGQSGALVNITLVADKGISSGAKKIMLKSQVFTEKNGTQSKWADASFDIQVVSAAVPEVTADNKSRKYGEENPEFTYTTSAGLDGKPKLTTKATKTSPVGEYDIVVEKGTIKGAYTAKNGTLTITKAPLKITAKSYTIKQGDPLPTFEAEYEGFKNNETAKVLTKKPKLSSTAKADSKPGRYDIIVSDAEAQNYNISYVKGTLTIIAADIDIESVKINYVSISHRVGETSQLSCKVTPENATANIEWTSDDASIASVNADGLVKFVRIGETVVRATAPNGKSDCCIVRVYPKEDEIITSMTKENVLMAFRIIDKTKKTCEVYGTFSTSAIDRNTSGTITIPAEVNGYKVIWLSDFAFYLCKNIGRIVLPNSLESFGNSALRKCEALGSLDIPNSVKYVTGYAVYSCKSLKTLSIPSSVEIIQENAFGWCTGLTSVTSYLTDPFEIDESVFEQSDAILYVPKGCKSKYQSSRGWNLFKNIVEFDPSGIESLMKANDSDARIYDLNGQRLNVPRKGIIIINGKKVVVK